ncbi:hypothetical protein Ahy_B09g097634 [Arachis hypogaea]|uniref:Uncharacterized protein n=1 Tax=Arachis hypogaea TaxID=3818 RepID=A0A444XPY2_ARAHY|nr:hypothetical protein Ahy_B09g097634 [Arachis hypogaea]
MCSRCSMPSSLEFASGMSATKGQRNAVPKVIFSTTCPIVKAHVIIFWLIVQPFYVLDRSGILTTLCDHSFQCPCVSKWTYLSCPVSRFFIPSSCFHIILDEYNCLLTSQLETQRQNILHDSDDEECLKILKNCWKAIHRMMGWTKFFLQCQSRQMLLRWLSGLMFS